MEGRFDWTPALTRDQLQQMAGEWLEMGASHVSVDTMGQGLNSVEGHLEALALSVVSVHRERRTWCARCSSDPR